MPIFPIFVVDSLILTNNPYLEKKSFSLEPRRKDKSWKKGLGDNTEEETWVTQ